MSTSISDRLPGTFPRIWPIIGIAGLSGFAGLGYEIIWTRMLANALGHELVAVLGVISALFAGLALGSLVPGQRIAASASPALGYAGLEIAIGAWALVLILLFPLVGDLVPTLIPIDASPMWQWLVAFALPFLLLLPATLAMGATLPALEAVLAPHLRVRAAVGPVYAANTLGAVGGTLVTTFVLIPVIGLSATLALCALLNMLCALALWRCCGGERVAATLPPKLGAPESGAHKSVAPKSPAALLAPLFLTGLLGIGYEILTIRVVSQILENTIYTFAVLLAAYLLGTAVGAGLHSRVAKRLAGDTLISALVIATSLACIVGTTALACSGMILAGLKGLVPPTMSGRLAAELGIAAVIFLPPTIAMGALFTELAQRARDRDGNLGAALAVNTFGGALA